MERIGLTMRILHNFTNIGLKKSVNCTSSAFYSSYGPHFINPEVSKEKLNQLFESGEASKLLHVPIKAALNYETSSVFHDELMRKLTNQCMRKGKKELARGLIEKAFANIKHAQILKYKKADDEEKALVETDPLKILHRAVENCSPLMELTSVKRGGVMYQVPMPIRPRRSRFLALQWLIEAGKEKDSKIRFSEKLAWELIDAASNKGRVVKRKVDLHRQCEANKAYAHYRWS